MPINRDDLAQHHDDLLAQEGYDPATDEAVLTPTFKVGDAVQSAPDSSDVTAMNATWIAVVRQVTRGVQGAPDGCCYTTHGRWVSDAPDARVTSRQLWCDTLVSYTHNPVQATATPRQLASVAMQLGFAREIANDSARRARVVRELRIAANGIGHFDTDLACEIDILVSRSVEGTGRQLVDDAVSIFFRSLD